MATSTRIFVERLDGSKVTEMLDAGDLGAIMAHGGEWSPGTLAEMLCSIAWMAKLRGGLTRELTLRNAAKLVGRLDDSESVRLRRVLATEAVLPRRIRE